MQGEAETRQLPRLIDLSLVCFLLVSLSVLVAWCQGWCVRTSKLDSGLGNLRTNQWRQYLRHPGTHIPATWGQGCPGPTTPTVWAWSHLWREQSASGRSASSGVLEWVLPIDLRSAMLWATAPSEDAELLCRLQWVCSWQFESAPVCCTNKYQPCYWVNPPSFHPMTHLLLSPP